MKVLKKIERKYYKYIDTPWTQPVLSADGTIGGNNFACFASSIYSTSYSAYEAFDNNTSTEWVKNRSETTSNIYFYNPLPLKVTNLEMRNRQNNNTGNAFVASGKVYGSNNNSEWTLITSFTNSNTTQGGVWDIDMSSNTGYYKYYRIENLTYTATQYSDYGYNQINITATTQDIEESDSSDYDFYKDIDVYKAPQKTTRKYYKYVISPWTQPVLTSNGLIGGYTMAVYSSRQSADSNTDVWKAFDGSTGSSSRWYPAGTGSSGIPIILTIYTPEAIKISNLQFTNYIYGSNAPNAFTVYGSSDNSSFTQLGTFTNTVQTANAVWDVDLSNNTNFYQYYKIEFTQWGGYPTGGRGITEIDITATQKTIIEGASSDYDFYEDIETYQAIV